MNTDRLLLCVIDRIRYSSLHACGEPHRPITRATSSGIRRLVAPRTSPAMKRARPRSFLDRLFVAFGQKGSLDVGGTAEMRIRKATEDGGGTSFADYVWKPVVLIEMKKRGADLVEALPAGVRLLGRASPPAARNTSSSATSTSSGSTTSTPSSTAPKTRSTSPSSPTRWGPLAFLFPTNERPVFGNDREAVTREAADKLADSASRNSSQRGVDRALAQRFILQTLVALFAEDIGLLPRYMFGALFDDCKKPADSYDLLGGLFEAMNTDEPPPAAGTRASAISTAASSPSPPASSCTKTNSNQLKGAATSTGQRFRPKSSARSSRTRWTPRNATRSGRTTRPRSTS